MPCRKLICPSTITAFSLASSQTGYRGDNRFAPAGGGSDGCAGGFPSSASRSASEAESASPVAGAAGWARSDNATPHSKMIAALATTTYPHKHDKERWLCIATGSLPSAFRDSRPYLRNPVR